MFFLFLYLITNFIYTKKNIKNINSSRKAKNNTKVNQKQKGRKCISK